jgi:hypothetical protein
MTGSNVIVGAAEYLGRGGVEDRCTRIAGDFFEAAGGDLQVLAQILHDWDGGTECHDSPSMPDRAAQRSSLIGGGQRVDALN